MSLKVMPQKKIIRRNSFNPPSSHSLSPARQQATSETEEQHQSVSHCVFQTVTVTRL